MKNIYPGKPSAKYTNRYAYGCIVTILCIVLQFCSYGSSAQTAYWLESVNDSVKFENIAFAPVAAAKATVLGVPGVPMFVFTDTRNGYVYWSDAGTGTIKKASTSGGYPIDVVTGITGAGVYPRGIYLDITNRILYWAETGPGATDVIKKISLAGATSPVASSGGTVVLSGIDIVRGITIDTTANQVYFAEAGAGASGKGIYRGSITTPGAESAATKIANLAAATQPNSVFFDEAGHFIYWSDFSISGKIQRAATNAASFPATAVNVFTGASVRGMSIDLSSNTIYWTQYPLLKIRSASLANIPVSGITNVVTGLYDLPRNLFISQAKDAPPSISSFSPTTRSIGQTININGKNFTGATAVTFGHIPAASFTVVSDILITAILADGNSGNVSVQNKNGTGTLGGFAFIPTPAITSFTPISAGGGAAVVIKGKHFTGATAVSFGGTSAYSFTIASDTVINAVVSSGSTGSVTVTTATGTATKTGFTFVPLAPPGSAIQLNGAQSIKANPSGTVSGSYTVEAWVRPADPTATMTIFSTRGSYEGTFDMKLIGGNLIHGDIGNGSAWLSTAADANYNYQVGTWYHIAYVVKPTGYVVYVNGDTAGSGSFSGTPLLYNANHPIDIGDMYNNEYFKGSIDEVRVYSSALTKSNVQADMKSTAISVPASLKMYYNFDKDVNNNARFATSVLGFSSQYSATDWAATHATGAPDIYPNYLDNPNAWASQNADDPREYIELGYDAPAPINFIDIYETYSPGAVDTVYAKNPNTGIYNIVYTATASPQAATARILHITFPLTSYPVSAIRIALNSGAVPDWNEIDAVKIGHSLGTNIPDSSASNFNGTVQGDMPPVFVESYAMVAAIAKAGGSVTQSSFVAGWKVPVTGVVNNYILDVARDKNFTMPVPGYSQLNVNGTSKIIGNLKQGTNYYYRVRANKNSVPGQGAYSSTITVTTIMAAPIITSFDPVKTGKGAPVTIYGKYFLEATAVSFGGVAAYSYNVLSDSVIVAVPNTGATGAVSVTTSGGTGSLAGFTYVTCNTVVTPTVEVSNNLESPICAGANLKYTANTTYPGVSPMYQWYKNNIIVGSNTKTYTDTTIKSTDSVWVIFTSSATCLTGNHIKSNVVKYQVIPRVSPTITIQASPSKNVCVGTVVTFTATASSVGDSPQYQWLKNNVNVGYNQVTYVDGNLQTGDVVTCKVTASAPCATPAIKTALGITMTVSPIVTPSVSITGNKSFPIAPGTAVTFTAAPVYGGTPSYQWYKNNVAVGTNSKTYGDATLANNDSVWVIMTSTAKCPTNTTAKSNVIIATVNGSLVARSLVSESSSGKDIATQNDKVRMYPNPVNNIVTVEFSAAGENKCEVQLVTSLGQVLRSKALVTARGVNIVSFSMGGYPSAMYFIRLIDKEHGIRTLKVVKTN